MDFKAYLAERAEMVEKALEEYLPVTDDKTQSLVKAMRYSLFLGGKRLRPILCLAGAEAVGGRPEDAMPAAAALEMIHTYSLIHDDLPSIDDDDLRRGKPSSHKVFGEAMAILAGDGLLTLGLGVLPEAAASGRLDPLKAMTALDIISRAAGHKGMVAGQAVDIESQGRDVDPETVRFLHEHKTAALLTAAVSSGAVLGGGSGDQVKLLEDYGRKIGLAFQIIDDILDIEGDVELLGKPVGSDQALGKATWPAVFGLQSSKDEAARLLNDAIEIIKEFGPSAEPLEALARYMLTRKN